MNSLKKDPMAPTALKRPKRDHRDPSIQNGLGRAGSKGGIIRKEMKTGCATRHVKRDITYVNAMAAALYFRPRSYAQNFDFI